MKESASQFKPVTEYFAAEQTPRFFSLNPDIHRELFDREPELATRLANLEENQALFVASYYSRDIDLKAVIELDDRSVDPLELVPFQTVFKFLSHGTIESPRSVKSGNLNHRFPAEVRVIDRNRWMYCKGSSSKNNLNALLALRLMRQKFNETPQESLANLTERAREAGYRLNPDALDRGFVRLASLSFEEKLRDKHKLPQDPNNDWYPDLARWLRIMSQEKAFRSKVVRDDIFPGGIELTEYPSIKLLPHLAYEHVCFLQEIPELLNPHQEFSPVDMISLCNSFYIFSQKVMLNCSESSEAVAQITEEVNLYMGVAIEMISRYRESGNQRLWDKRTRGDWKADFGHIPSVNAMRQQIQRAGGRAPRHLNIQAKYRRELGSG